ncbi:MAG: serine/threonine protein kinase [Polyangiaceae bacterium]|nr:serine/threonine protein kinase [Polyangiaceae bacterium]
MAPVNPDGTPCQGPIAPQRRPSDDLGLIGTIIDRRYLVEEVVGAGGFGVVFRARHVSFDSAVAIKVFVRSGGQVSAVSAVSAAEGRLLFKLAPLHSAFVHVFEAGTVPCPGRSDLAYLAMEWLEGITLKSLLTSLEREGRTLALDTVLHLFDGLAQGLSVAHARRIAHRDLKPSNVFLMVTDGQVVPKLLDFGLAKEGSPTDDVYDDTALARSPFTPAYGAPEQWDRSFGATGPWTDVYSFALVLVELLVGRRWNGHLEPGGVMRATLDSARRPTPGALGVTVPPGVEAAFARALAVDPRQRFPDLGCFWRALGEGTPWKHPGTSILAASLGVAAPVLRGTLPVGDPALAPVPSSRRLVGTPTAPSLGVTTLPPGSAHPAPPVDHSSRTAIMRSLSPIRLWRGRRVATLLLAGCVLAAGVAVAVLGVRRGPMVTEPNRTPPGAPATAVASARASAVGPPAAVSVGLPPTANDQDGLVAPGSSVPGPGAAGSMSTGPVTPPARSGPPSAPAAAAPTPPRPRAARTGPTAATPSSGAGAVPTSGPNDPAAVLLEPPMLTRK